MSHILGRYQVAHSCRPELHEAMASWNGIIYGAVTACGVCKRTWILLPYKPWLRRSIKAFGENGWWLRETRAQAKRRTYKLEKRIDAEFQEIVSKL